mgnify:CR=1 FL=1
MIDGILNVYKEQDYTSFDVVAKLRGILKQKKIGHTGTLDPMAEGVLLVCLGKATKLVDLLTEGDKCYRATMKLGYETDTEDVTGETIAEGDAAVLAQLTQADVKRAILSFIGKYDQIPPMYSAIKKDGKKLYEYARAGIEVKREPRPVEIYAIQDITKEADDTYSFDVYCSKGTYIRSLCRDIGRKLSTDIERPDDRIRNHTLLSIILDTEEGKEEWEDISGYRTGIAEETLDRVSLCLLFFIYHIAYQHLERLHRHVDARIEEHQRYQSEEHRTAHGQSERTGIREQAHYQDGNRSTHKEIRDAATEAAPRLITQRAHDRLNQDSHQRRENPEITQTVRVSAQSGKDAGNVGALKCVCNLHAKKTEAQVPELPET